MWYQFKQDRDGYMVAGSYLVKLLRDKNDPRDSIYFGTNGAGSIVGASLNPDDEEGAGVKGKSYLSDGYFGMDASIDIISYEENLLIQAECNYILENESIAIEKLEKAQDVAENKWGFDEDTFSDISLLLTGTDLYNKIIEEKYIALFLNIEIWNDYKRNCYPEVKYKKSQDNSGNPIYKYPPGRFYYPEDERITNSSIPNITSQPEYNYNDIQQCGIE